MAEGIWVLGTAPFRSFDSRDFAGVRRDRITMLLADRDSATRAEECAKGLGADSSLGTAPYRARLRFALWMPRCTAAISLGRFGVMRSGRVAPVSVGRDGAL